METCLGFQPAGLGLACPSNPTSNSLKETSASVSVSLDASLSYQLGILAHARPEKMSPTHLPLRVEYALVLDLIEEAFVGQVRTGDRHGFSAPPEVQVFRGAGFHWEREETK